MLALLATLATGLGVFGFASYFAARGETVSAPCLVYLSLQLFTLNSGMVDGPIPWSLQIARFFAPSLAFTALAKTLTVVFRAELRTFRLSRSRGHIVICGAGEKAAALIRDYTRDRRRVVMIDTAEMPPAPASTCPGHIFAIREDATCPETLKKARADRAERVFVTTGNDSTNIEIAASLFRLADVLNKRNGNLHCHVHLVDRSTAELFRQHRIFKDASDLVDINTFNVYDNAARLLWRDHLLARGPVAPTDTRRMRLVIVGLGQMGEAILLRVLRSAHYANGSTPAVTVIDRAADVCRGCLQERYPALSRLCDINFVAADLGRPETVRLMAETLSNPGEIGTAVLCLDDDYANFAAALQVASHIEVMDARVFIRLAHAAGLCELLQAERSDASPARLIDGFGLSDTCCTRELVLADGLSCTARLLHESYVADQLRKNPRASSPSLEPWETLDETWRDSNREQAEHVELKLRTFGYSSEEGGRRPPERFYDAEVEVMGRMEHARWCAERELAGWTFAPGAKDIAQRTSPHLVPWERLSDEIRDYDFQFVRNLPRILLQRCRS